MGPPYLPGAQAHNPAETKISAVNRLFIFNHPFCKNIILNHLTRVYLIWSQISIFFNLREFPITDTELKLIAAAAMIGLRRIPTKG